MKHKLSAAVMLPCALLAGAQTESADSIPVKELEEIVVEAPKVVRKADMEVYHPSQSAVEASKNGLQLLTNLMIPTLAVSDVLGTVEAAGQSVQLRINGRESTITQVVHCFLKQSSAWSGLTIPDCVTAELHTCSILLSQILLSEARSRRRLVRH